MRLGLLTLMSLAVPATAGDFSLSSPIDCDLAGPCHIQQYVDHDATAGARDFTCGGLTYDGHRGTDFALPTQARIADGIGVLAAAAGTVLGLRDGMPDTGYSADTATDIENRECGNGVVLQHDGGWQTQYCHLRQGSVAVAKGQRVTGGQILGQVGMSGRAEFPHVHLSVRLDGEVVDPFDPDGVLTCGTPSTETLWDGPLPVRPGGIVTIGTSNAIPDFATIRAGQVTGATATGDALIIYAFLFGTRTGDVLRLSLNGPDGMVVERDTRLKRAQAQSFRAIGKKRRAPRWPAGEYTGFAELIRDGRSLERQELTLTLR